MEKEMAEPGSIDELFEIADLIKEKHDAPLTSGEILLIATQVRANDIAYQQAENIESVAESFVQVCAQIMSFVVSMQEKEAKKPSWEERLQQMKRR